jgi:hypothetical protein
VYKSINIFKNKLCFIKIHHKQIWLQIETIFIYSCKTCFITIVEGHRSRSRSPRRRSPRRERGVQHNFKSVHVSNLFWSREYNSAKGICKYASFSKVGGNYPLDLKIIWSSGASKMCGVVICCHIISPPYFWKWCIFAYFLCTVVLSTSEKIAYMYNFKIMLDTSVIQKTQDASEMCVE